MNIAQAYSLARSLMNKHGLENWGFEFDKSVRRFGACHYRKKKITLSRRLVQDNSEEEVAETCKHEIAHAKSWLKHGRAGCGHGHLWKQMCIEVGARLERCYDSNKVNNTAQPKFLLRHKETGKIHGKYFRRPKWANRVHEIWLKNDKSAKGKLELIENYGMVANTNNQPERPTGISEFNFD